MTRLNRRSLGASVLQSFTRTTQYGTLFGQVEKLIQEFFDSHLDSWDISSVNGSPVLMLDFQNVDFSKAEMPPQGTSNSSNLVLMVIITVNNLDFRILGPGVV